MNALRMFTATQNEDGSWGAEDKRRLATPLVLLCFLGNGETGASPEFGEAIVRAHKYLLAYTPSDDPEHIAGIVALSEYVGIHVAGSERNLAEAEINRIRSFLSAVQDTAKNPWIDYLTSRLIPPEIVRPAWMKYTTDLPKRWSEAKVNVEPNTLDDYLALLISGNAKFRIGGKVWEEFNWQIVPKMIERQTPEGFFPCQPETDPFACTALAVQMMQVYYAWRPQFMPMPESEREDKNIEGNAE